MFARCGLTVFTPGVGGSGDRERSVQRMGAVMGFCGSKRSKGSTWATWPKEVTDGILEGQVWDAGNPRGTGLIVSPFSKMLAPSPHIQGIDGLSDHFPGRQ